MTFMCLPGPRATSHHLLPPVRIPRGLSLQEARERRRAINSTATRPPVKRRGTCRELATRQAASTTLASVVAADRRMRGQGFARTRAYHLYLLPPVMTPRGPSSPVAQEQPHAINSTATKLPVRWRGISRHP